MSENKPIHDMSTRTAPKEWLEAESQSPQDGSFSNVRVSRRFRLLPSGTRADSFTIAFGSLLGAILAGGMWYLGAATDMFEWPWISVAVGVMLATVLRITAGRLPGSLRAGIALSVYVVVALVVAFLWARIEVTDIYGDMATAADYEHNLRARFTDPIRLLAYGAGAAAAWFLSILGGP
jgi:hypothetical protein